MNNLGRGHGKGKVPIWDGREDLEDSCVGYYWLRLADLITCCFTEPQDRSAAKKSKVEDQRLISQKPSKLKRKRKTSIPCASRPFNSKSVLNADSSLVSRYNPSVCYQQPPRRSQLLWPSQRPGDVHPVPRSSQHYFRTIADDEDSTGSPTSRHLQRGHYDIGGREVSAKKSKIHNPRRRSGVIADPNALINRPKSAYTRGLRVTDEEPVFWQHSHRATSRFRQSQFSTSWPSSPPTSQHYTTSRRSNASNFESLLEETFASQPTLNLQPNPIINIEPPATPNLPPTPIEDLQQLQEESLPSPPTPNSPPLEDAPSRRRFSGFRPLQLSFYLPGNRLSLLPRFSDDNDTDVPPVPGITRPPSALMKAKPGPTYSSSLTSYSIPRKAVASRATSAADESNRSSFQSSVTLNGGTYSRGSLLHDRLRSDLRLSRSTWRNTQELSRPASRSWAEDAKRFSQHRVSAQTLQLETNHEEPQQVEFECPTISEECSPVSPISPACSEKHTNVAYHDYEFTGEVRRCQKQHSTVDYHDYEFVGEVCQDSEQRSAVEYHDYEFVGEARRVPEIQESSFQGDSLHVAPLFHSSTGSTDSNNDELPLRSKPRSSSGSSTLYHGESSSESDLPVFKTTLSVAFPSPTLQHRLSDWLSRSASQVQAFSPQRGECYAHTDSPTLGFSWKDFGFNSEKAASKGEGGSQYGRRRALTDGSLASTYVDGDDDIDLEKFPMPASLTHTVGVGVAF